MNLNTDKLNGVDFTPKPPSPDPTLGYTTDLGFPHTMAGSPQPPSPHMIDGGVTGATAPCETCDTFREKAEALDWLEKEQPTIISPVKEFKTWYISPTDSNARVEDISLLAAIQRAKG